MTDGPSAADHHIAQCPTPTAHKRLDEAHRFWHACLDNYQDPEGFRANLNAAIQALRNVTFVLQKEKRLIPDFDAWYQPHRDAMGADPVMRWVIESRNRIVKEGDLETESIVRARNIGDYAAASSEVQASLPTRIDNSTTAELDDAAAKIYTPPPRYRLHEILANVAQSTPDRILRESTLSIERRWVDQRLREHELLDAMAHAYGMLAGLIDDAHTQVGMQSGVVHEPTGLPFPAEDPFGDRRLPCMGTSRSSRTLNIRLGDGSPAEGVIRLVEYDEAVAKAAAKRFRSREPEILPEDIDSIHDLLDYYVEIGRAILRKDPDHGWFAYLFRGTSQIAGFVMAARDRADKRDLAQRLAETAITNGADGVVMTGEVWVSTFELDSNGLPITPEDSKDRTEALVVSIETADGRASAATIPFRRHRLRRTEIDETIFERDLSEGRLNFFAPLRDAWAHAAGRDRPGTVEPDHQRSAEPDETEEAER